VAVQMDEAEQSTRMQNMRSHLRLNDVFRWCRSFETGTLLAPISATTESVHWTTVAAMAADKL